MDVRRITSGVKRKQTYAERMEMIREGREGREKFGSKKGKKLEHGASTTNREKQKKTKNFMMIVHKRSVKGKSTRSLRDKQVFTYYYSIIMFNDNFCSVFYLAVFESTYRQAKEKRILGTLSSELNDQCILTYSLLIVRQIIKNIFPYYIEFI